MQTRKDQLLELLKESPNDVFLYYALGLEYLAEQKHQLAQECFENALKIDANYLAAYYQLGMLYYQMDKKEMALDYLKKGLELARQKKSNKDIAEFNALITNIENDLL